MKRPCALFLCLLMFLATAAVAGQDAPAAGGKPALTIFKNGSRPSAKAPDDHFTGNVRFDPLFSSNDSINASANCVTFEPGARTAWHSHPTGQYLIVLSGSGLIQQWGGPVREINPGDVIWIPPNVKHWHGAAPKTAMTHIAITGVLKGQNADWLEKVSEDQYPK